LSFGQLATRNPEREKRPRQTALDIQGPLGLHAGVARALRIQRAGGRYHVTARGNERKKIFRDDTDHFHFLELLSQFGEQFGARVHAYVLMDNHYHLLLETPEANLSRAMHWLNAGYCGWFNRRHGRSGHLGRLSLTQLGTLVGGLDYAVVSKAIRRFAHRLATDDALRQKMSAIQARLSK